MTRRASKSQRRANRRWWRPIVEILAIIVIAVLLTAVLKAVAFRVFLVPSESMSPTLVTDDRIVVELVSRHFQPYTRGDVVVFTDTADWLGNGAGEDASPNLLQLLGLEPDASGYLVKRIMAGPGETIEGLADGTILIDGEVFDDPYSPTTEQAPFIWTLSEDEYWVMGDNRGGSADSRVNGPVAGSEIVGRVGFVLFPFARFGGLDG